VTEHVEHSRWVERSGRVGFAAKGISYFLVALLALKVAVGGGGQPEDHHGALEAVANEPFGWALIALVAVGFGCYAIWRVVQAVFDRDDEGDDAAGIAKRLGYFGQGVLYAGLAVGAGAVLAHSGNSNSQQEDEATAFALDLPLGRWLVGLAGVGFIGAGVFNGYRAVSGSFREKLREGAMQGAARPWYIALGVAGHLARAVVFALVGVFLLRAAWQFDPDEAVGLDEALQKLAAEPHGAFLLGSVALGLAAYGLFCLVEARYRDV
jgi:uncharacterized protein DUF1206